MFGNAQKKIIACALTCVAGTVIVALAVGAISLGAVFLSAFSTVVWPLAIAIILALLLQPICDFFETRLRFPRTLAVVALFVSVVAAAAGFAFLAIPFFVNEAVEILRGLPDLRDRAAERFPEFVAWLDANFSREKFYEMLENRAGAPERVRELLATLTPHLHALLQTSGELFAKIAAAAAIPIYFYWLVSERHDIVGTIEREAKVIFSKRVARDIAFLVRQFRDILIAFFRGQVVIGFLYGLILALGFGLLGIPGGVLVGLLIGMLNIVPYLGTLIGLGLILPISFLTGGVWLAVAAFAVFCAAQLTESYFLTPKIMGSRTGLHPMIIMLAVFFWGEALNGLIGMVLAVPLTAFFVVFWRLFKRRRASLAALGGVPASASAGASSNSSNEIVPAESGSSVPAESAGRGPSER